MPLDGGASLGDAVLRAAAAVAAQPPGPGDPVGPVPQAAAVHITNTRAVSQTSVLLRDASLARERMVRSAEMFSRAWTRCG
jgi:hypothetical protein